jgi:hypothetical protein
MSKLIQNRSLAFRWLVKPMRFTAAIVIVASLFILASTIDSKENKDVVTAPVSDVVSVDKIETTANYKLEPDLDEFGVHANDYIRESGYFSKRESVYGLLEQKGLDRLRIHEIATALKVLFDPSKIYPSQRYFIYTSKFDTSANPVVAKLIIE